MQASLEQTVAAMRFFLAYQSATTWQSQGPLSEDDFLNKLHEWAVISPTSTRCAHTVLLRGFVRSWVMRRACAHGCDRHKG